LVLLVRRLLVLHEGASTLTAEHLPERMLGAESPNLNRGSDAQRSAQAPAKSESVDLPALISALRASGGNVARASAALGITRQRAYRLMEGNAIDLEALREAEEPRR
jgi:transcriptional regulator with PAS, ATPase and Fis domain